MDDDRIKNIAVVVSGLDEEYQNNIICGINQAARDNSMNISYFSAFGGMLASKRFDIGEYSIYNLIDFTRFDGAILMTNTISDTSVRERVIQSVRKAGIPAVIFDCDNHREFYNISIDNTTAMRELISHVITKHGARVLNYISGPLENPEARARYDAFFDVLRENGITPDERRIYYGGFRSPDGRQAVDDFMESGMSMPDAFICANDAMALTAVTALEKYGFKVPEDVIVTGFDYTYNARNFTPALTSVDRPLYTAGLRAGNVICSLADGLCPENDLRLKAVPVFSESCGCSASAESADIKEYRKRTYRHVETMNSNISTLNRLIAGLAETENSSENYDMIESIAAELECEKFSLCLTEDWQDAFGVSMPVDMEKPSYSAYMTAPIIWDKGERRSVGYFPSSSMYPEFPETGGNISYFMPLHFRERCLGYCIITNGDFPIASLLCQSLTMTISNSIENIRKLFHLNKAMDELNRLYVIDPLCNIYNRNGFINIADDMYHDCVTLKRKVMLSFVDMDGLKYINDNYGHNEGDFAIQRLASVIQECCGHGSICARFGGDEFVIFDSGATEGSAEALERKFNAKLDNMNAIIKKPYKLSASIGSVITFAEEDKTLYYIIHQADEKMYEIKRGKKNSRRSESSADTEEN